MKKNLISYIALAVACVMLGAGVTAGLNTSASAADSSTTTVVYTSPFTAAIAAVRDSVVGVNNYQTQRYSTYGSGRGSYGFGYGFGYGGYGSDEYETKEVLSATGSGVCIADKYVLTNYHVVEGASSLKISISDEDTSEATTYDAELVAYDENLDIAILKCDSLTVKPVTLGDSDTLQVGDWAICIGNPLSETFSGTVTAGIVSGLNRSISSSSSTTDKYGRKSTTTNTMIQIDAAINSGNSGGGMFSVTGELMGIPTLKYSGSSSSGTDVDGIGMCIPINSCKELIEEVLSGKVTAQQQDEETDAASSSSSSLDMTGRPRMGITMTTMSAQNSSLSYAVRYGVYYGQLPQGVYVSVVDEDSPAAKAGIQVGDIIVDVNDTVITGSTQIQQLVAAHAAGDVLKVKVYRVPGITELGDTTSIPEGEYVDVEVTL